MDLERLSELRTKILFGGNLLNYEARELWWHFSNEVIPQPKRCGTCNATGVAAKHNRVVNETCWSCGGTGYRDEAKQ